MSTVRAPVSEPAPTGQEEQVPKEAAPPGNPQYATSRRALTPGIEAIREALAVLKFGEAPRLGFLGDTRSGKTHAMRLCIGEFLAQSVGFIAVVDDKDPARAQYEGQMRVDVMDLIGQPLDPQGPRVVVFRGDTVNGGDVEPDRVAEYAWAVKRAGWPICVVYDELGHDQLVSYGQWRSGVVWTPRSFTKGGGVGVATIWGAQMPQQVPQTAFDQSSHIMCFKLAGQSLAKLRDRDYLVGGDLDKIIPTLAGEPLPPAQRGEFVLLRRGQSWNGKIYKL